MSTSNFGWPLPADTDLVRDGAAAIRALGDAVDSTVAAGFRFVGTRYFLSDGDFEKADPLGDGNPAGVVLRAVVVTALGGGGAGGTLSTGDVGAGGGGAGGFTTGPVIAAADLAASVPVNVGAGGIAPATEGSGDEGGLTEFGTVSDAYYRACSGGEGGSADGGGGRGGLVPSGGAIVNRGGDGGSGGENVAGGSGGASFYGGGGRGARRAGAFGLAGASSICLGAGGGGAQRRTSGDRVGGDGTAGIVVVDCYA